MITSSEKPSAGWIVSAPYDLAFLANIAWPLLLIGAIAFEGFVQNDGRLQTEFWQIYFLTTPHRWITLFLVVADPDRREGQNRLFVGIALVGAMIVFLVSWITGALTCLLLIDYLWNSWHFASQHQGVLRMYARKAGSGPKWLESHCLRVFVVYTLLRTAGWTTGWFEAESSLKVWLNRVDMIVLVIPGVILIVNLFGMHRGRTGKVCYLVSLLTLYSALLFCLRIDSRTGVFALTAASSTFHAIEYLAVVSHYARRRESVGSDGLFRTLAKQWGTVFAAYLLALGLIGLWLDHSGERVMRFWTTANVWAAFLHCTYDGFIWKLRRPATAYALGVPA